MSGSLKTAVILIFILNLMSTAAQAQQALTLGGDFIGMTAVQQQGKAKLAVFLADDSRPDRQRLLDWFTKEKNEKNESKLSIGTRIKLWPDVAAYDVCRLSRTSPDETLIFLRPDGIYNLSDKSPLVRHKTLFAHAKDDALPQVKLCFDLFAGESPALVVPTLEGIAVFRQQEAGVFSKHAELKAKARLRFTGQPLRRHQGLPSQRISLNYEFPDVTAIDYNGDQLIDLCLVQSDDLTCYLQKEQKGFNSAAPLRQRFNVVTAEEEKSTSLRLQAKLLDLNGDNRADMIIQKANYSLSEMGASLLIYFQTAGGHFSDKPSQVLHREGFFGFQEYFDFDGDGHVDILAPVADLGWSKIASMYLTKSADIEFIWYRNEKGKFSEKPQTLHHHKYPIDFRNWSAIQGALPLWQVPFLKNESGLQTIFFPNQTHIEVFSLNEKGLKVPAKVKREMDIGTEVAAFDLDQDGYAELISAWPRHPKYARRLSFIDSLSQP